VFLPRWRSSAQYSKRLRNFSDSSGFAASGYRNRTSGALTNVGSNGYSWSSSPNSAGSTNAGNLNFNASNVNPFNNNNRANGFPVRCVRAFTAA